jgi:hypothetical protein
VTRNRQRETDPREDRGEQGRETIGRRTRRARKDRDDLLQAEVRHIIDNLFKARNPFVQPDALHSRYRTYPYVLCADTRESCDITTDVRRYCRKSLASPRRYLSKSQGIQPIVLRNKRSLKRSCFETDEATRASPPGQSNQLCHGAGPEPLMGYT